MGPTVTGAKVGATVTGAKLGKLLGVALGLLLLGLRVGLSVVGTALVGVEVGAFCMWRTVLAPYIYIYIYPRRTLTCDLYD